MGSLRANLYLFADPTEVYPQPPAWMLEWDHGSQLFCSPAPLPHPDHGGLDCRGAEQPLGLCWANGLHLLPDPGAAVEGCLAVWEQMPWGTLVCGFKRAGKVGLGQPPLRQDSLQDDLQDRVAEGKRLFMGDWLQQEPESQPPRPQAYVLPSQVTLSVLAQGGQGRLWECENESLLPPRVVATLFITLVDHLQMSQTFVTHRRDS